MDNFKKSAAEAAIKFVTQGMVLGLGTGSTTRIFIDLLSENLKSGKIKDIKGVPTSVETAMQASRLGIQLVSLSEYPDLDLAVDGADQVDPDLNLIKGLGGALLREKIVEMHAKRFVVIVDESKMVEILGSGGALPVEIVQFEADIHKNWLESLGCKTSFAEKKDGTRFVTDNGNFIVHCHFPNNIEDPYFLAGTLEHRAGIVGHGLFLDMADVVIAAGDAGVRFMERER